jgi:hypothetical protein
MRAVLVFLMSAGLACGGTSSGEQCSPEGESRCASSTTIEVCSEGQWRAGTCAATDAGIVTLCRATLKEAHCVSVP